MAITQYTEKYEPDGSAGNLSKAINSQAISDANTNGYLTVMLIFENDFIADSTKLFTPTTSGGFVNTDGGRVAMSETSGTGSDPMLSVTYTDGSTDDIGAITTGNFDDAFLRTNAQTSEANMLAARNAEDADAITVTGLFSTLGNYKVFSSAFNARLAFKFVHDVSKTVSSANLRFYFFADITSGFQRMSWQNRGVYACKLIPAATTFKVEDWSHMDGWESSGSYEAVATVAENAVFFGTNF